MKGAVDARARCAVTATLDGRGPEGHVLHIATANVCTLGVSKFDDTVLSVEVPNALGRAQLLEGQLDANCLDIVCIQEGRATDDQIRAGATYDMYIAGALDGSCGSQVWIRKGIHAEVILANAVTPRVMTVAARLRGHEPIAIVSAHAPCLLSPPAARGAFWRELTHATAALRTRWPSAMLVVGIDADARVGSAASPHIGPAAPDVENDNGACLRHFLDQPTTRLWTQATRGPLAIARRRALTSSAPPPCPLRLPVSSTRSSWRLRLRRPQGGCILGVASTMRQPRALAAEQVCGQPGQPGGPVAMQAVRGCDVGLLADPRRPRRRRHAPRPPLRTHQGGGEERLRPSAKNPEAAMGLGAHLVSVALRSPTPPRHAWPMHAALAGAVVHGIPGYVAWRGRQSLMRRTARRVQLEDGRGKSLLARRAPR